MKAAVPTVAVVHDLAVALHELAAATKLAKDRRALFEAVLLLVDESYVTNAHGTSTHATRLYRSTVARGMAPTYTQAFAEKQPTLHLKHPAPPRLVAVSRRRHALPY